MADADHRMSRGGGRASALLLAAAVTALAAGPAEAFRHRSEWRRSFETAGRARLEIRNTFGGVDVRSWDRPVIEVVAEVRIKAPSRSMAEEIRGGIEFDTDFDGSSLRVEAAPPRVRMTGLAGESAASVSIRYSVRVPESTGLDIETRTGGIDAAGVGGCFRLVTGDGPVSIDSSGGEGMIRATDGDVECVLKSFPAAGRLEISASGTVRLTVPPDTGARLDAETSWGEVEVLMEMVDIEESKRRLARGVLGDGTGRIEIRSSGGDIYLRAAGPPAEGG